MALSDLLRAAMAEYNAKTIKYRSTQLAGAGRGGVWVHIEPVASGFYTLHIGGDYVGLVQMDDFGFVVPIGKANAFHYLRSEPT